MKSIPKISRRDLLIFCLGAGSAYSLTKMLNYLSHVQEDQLATLQSLFETTIKDLEDNKTFNSMGKAYYQEHMPNKNLLKVLIPELHSGNDTLRLAEIEKRFLDQIQEDFIEGRTFLFQGWVLSKTEGEIGALAYILEKSHLSN